MLLTILIPAGYNKQLHAHVGQRWVSFYFLLFTIPQNFFPIIPISGSIVYSCKIILDIKANHIIFLFFLILALF